MGILNRKKSKKQREERRNMGLGLADQERQSPLHADEQDAPEPERVTRPDEAAGTAVHEMKEPPKAEG